MEGLPYLPGWQPFFCGSHLKARTFYYAGYALLDYPSRVAACSRLPRAGRCIGTVGANLQRSLIVSRHEARDGHCVNRLGVHRLNLRVTYPSRPTFLEILKN